MARYGHRMVTLDNKAYVIGGHTNQELTDTIEEHVFAGSSVTDVTLLNLKIVGPRFYFSAAPVLS